MKLFWCTILLALTSTAFASEHIMTLDKYYQAECEDYTGTWQGFITDRTDLFDDGGPWPITLKLYQQNGIIWGRTSEVKSKKHVTFASNEFWAQCKNGKLQNIFWGKKNSCGALSQQGGLISRNVLALQLNWENAMTGAELLVFLQRKNNLAPYYESSHLISYDPSAVKTCH